MAHTISAGQGIGAARSGFMRAVVGASPEDDALLSCALAQMGQVTYDQLCTLLSLSLAATPILARRYLVPVVWSQDRIRAHTLADGRQGWLMPLETQDALLEAPFLISDPSNPQATLQSGVDFEFVQLSSASRGLWLAQDPLSDTRFTRTVVHTAAAPPRTSVRATVQAGDADSQLPDPLTDPSDYVDALALRDRLRRTVDLSSVVATLRIQVTASVARVSSVTGGDPLASAWVGARLRYAKDGAAVETPIRGITQTEALDTAPLAIPDGVYAAAVVRDDIAGGWLLGQSMVLRDSNDTYDSPVTVLEILSGTSVLVDQATEFADGQTHRVFHWSAQPPPYVDAVVLFMVDALVDAGHLTQRWAPLVGIDAKPQRMYKDVMLGAAEMLLRGPSTAAVKALANATLALPVIRGEGEVHLRTIRGATEDTVVTTRAAYVVPTGLLRSDLLTVSSPAHVFEELEALTDALRVDDARTDPTWFYGQPVPAQVVAQVASVVANVQLEPFTLGPGRLCQDPGLYVGADYDAQPLTSSGALRTYTDAVYNPDSLTLTMLAERVYPTSANATILHEYSAYRASTVNLSARRITLRSGLPAGARRVGTSVVSNGAFGMQLSGCTTPLRASDAGLGVLINGLPARITRVRSTTSALIEPIGTTSLSTGPVSVELCLRISVLERPGLALSVGAFAMAWAGANVARLVWKSAATPPTSLLRSLSYILSDSKPSAVLLDASSFTGMADAAAYLDAGMTLALTIYGHGFFGIGAYPSVGGAWPSWSMGELHGGGMGALMWETRLAPDELQGAATLDDAHIHGQDSSELWLWFESLEPWTYADIWSYIWDGQQWVMAQHQVVGDGSGSQTSAVAVFDSYGTPTAFRVEVAGGSTQFAAAVGARRTTPQSRVQAPSDAWFVFDAVQDDDTAEFVGVAGLDAGSILSLTYPADPSQGFPVHYDLVAIGSAIGGSDSCTLVTLSGAQYACPRSQTGVIARWLGNVHWGLLPRRNHTPISLDSIPQGAGSRQWWVADAPLVANMFWT